MSRPSIAPPTPCPRPENEYACNIKRGRLALPPSRRTGGAIQSRPTLHHGGMGLSPCRRGLTRAHAAVAEHMMPWSDPFLLENGRLAQEWIFAIGGVCALSRTLM